MNNILKFDNSDFELSLRIDNFSSDKDFRKFIKNVETLVRRSGEYKLWVSYLISNCGAHVCTLTHERANETSVEIHHSPINLYLICQAVTEKYLDSQKQFCVFDICLEVMELHFNNNVGWTPILSNLHEKIHNGYLKFPNSKIQGNYQYILDNYKFSDENFKKITELEAVKIEDCEINWGKENYPGLINAA